MKRDKYPKSIRYYGKLTDDFTACDSPKKIDKHYKYIKSGILWRVASFILYRLVATPVGFIYTRVLLRERIIGRERLRGAHGFVLVGNHTETLGDPFTPSMVAFPRRTYVVVHPDNVSLPVIGSLTPMLGALPTPSDLGAARALSLAVEQRLREGGAVAVYPEAHVWDKYTALRPFDPSAFDLAVRNGAPVYSMTRTYKKHRLFGFVRRVYIDGPFYPDMTVSRGEAARRMCSEVRAVMEKRCLLSDVEVIKYIRKENND